MAPSITPILSPLTADAYRHLARNLWERITSELRVHLAAAMPPETSSADGTGIICAVGKFELSLMYFVQPDGLSLGLALRPFPDQPDSIIGIWTCFDNPLQPGALFIQASDYLVRSNDFFLLSIRDRLVNGRPGNSSDHPDLADDVIMTTVAIIDELHRMH